MCMRVTLYYLEPSVLIITMEEYLGNYAIFPTGMKRDTEK